MVTMQNEAYAKRKIAPGRFVVAALAICSTIGPAILLADPPEVKSGADAQTLLLVRTTPSGAEIRLDGEKMGLSGQLLSVKPGTYKLVVDMTGHEPIEQQITIRDGRITRIELKLRASPELPGTEPLHSAKVFRARNFVRLVVGEEGMTFQAQPTTWDDLPKLLEDVPDPAWKVSTTNCSSMSPESTR